MASPLSSTRSKETAHVVTQAKDQPTSPVQRSMGTQRPRGSTHPLLSQSGVTNETQGDVPKERAKPVSLDSDLQLKYRSPSEKPAPLVKRVDRPDAPLALNTVKRHHFSGGLMPRSSPVSPLSPFVTSSTPPQLGLLNEQLPSSSNKGSPPQHQPPIAAPPPVPAKPAERIQQEKVDTSVVENARIEPKTFTKMTTTNTSGLGGFQGPYRRHFPAHRQGSRTTRQG